ncbi:MAG: helicase-related protein, partial [Dehalococcoidia bacterium]
ERFMQEARRDPFGQIGRTIIFAVNQRHATEITKILNELQPELAVTITSRVEDASTIAKDCRDRKRPERVAVSVDMLSTGYNCQDLLNVVLMRPIFSPTEYIQIKGRGTRLWRFSDGKTEWAKERFSLLDFCGVAEYFEETYDYTVPLRLPQPRQRTSAASVHEPEPVDPYTEKADDPLQPAGKREIPTWAGRDTVVSQEVRIVGPDGEKVDVMTFRGSWERDLKALQAADPEFRDAVANEDDEAVERVLQQKVFHRPEMYYSPEKLATSYGVPAPAVTFVYGALGQRPIPTREQVIGDTVSSIAARFDLRYSEQQWVAATLKLIADDRAARERFLKGDARFFDRPQFTALGGLKKLVTFGRRDEVFEALRVSTIARSS